MDVIDETAQVLASLRGVWDEVEVDELDHALQAGRHAVLDGADDELILASVLHDVGHSPLVAVDPSVHHEDAAQEWLDRRFGERVGWLAGSHVRAKQYLAATDPDYVAALSPTSIRSLAYQGGALVRSSRAGHPWWSDALRLRRYDDAAKVPGAQALSVDEVLEFARRVVSR
ncbi:HD family phosphohydrolase [Williamsia maris]|uniref:HD phosphohydrolase n=1 Tax=Williamsia maris TaxID=72806 RepID=A0ABT1HGN8_9NOCA|nr:HD family phosphohydrolase [Williamsia maris]MCP2177412.1 putative HD phosphohydrolase [Williamsia maris]